MPSRILITGGASGFGRALAEIYAARGERVLVTDLAPVGVGSPGSTTDLGGSPTGLPVVTGAGEVAHRQLDVRATWLGRRRRTGSSSTGVGSTC